MSTHTKDFICLRQKYNTSLNTITFQHICNWQKNNTCAKAINYHHRQSTSFVIVRQKTHVLIKLIKLTHTKFPHLLSSENNTNVNTINIHTVLYLSYLGQLWNLSIPKRLHINNYHEC